MIRNEADTVEPVATPHGTLALRSETAADAVFLFGLHETVKGPELAPMGVPDQMRRNLLEMQFRAMTMGYRAQFPDGYFGIVTLDEVPIGRLVTDDSEGWFHIVHIALLPEWRNRGISTALMTAVLDRPRRMGVRCQATIALDNFASLCLWSRLGFTERERDEINLIAEWRPS
jgi:GNAT superfamily N-acetyltransferase